MRSSAILAALVILLCGCGRTKTAENSATSEPARQAIDRTKPIASKEQIGSSVRVRVIAGGLPVKDVTGAILHREELPETGAYFELNRCVLALLDGWTKEQLQDKQTKYLIFRNLPDDQGELRAKSYYGKLLEFDEVSGVATIAYKQGFSAETDLGFKIERKKELPKEAVALRFINREVAQPISPPNPERAQTARVFPPMSASAGRFSVSDDGLAVVKFPAFGAGSSADESALVATGPLVLRGFVRASADGAATLVAIPELNVASRLPNVILVSALFEVSDRDVAMRINIEARNQELVPMSSRLRIVKMEPGTKMELSALKPPFKPIGSWQTETSAVLRSDAKQVIGTLPLPATVGEEISQIVQLGWRIPEAGAETTNFSRPFIVKVRRKTFGMEVTTEGIVNLSDAPPATDTASESFPIEAEVLHIFEIAGGREVLMQLKGEPFWKRFSMEKRRWLPLPPINLSTVDLAGNLNSLFVLDRTAGQLQRYELGDLKLAASATLALKDQQLYAIRAGCNSARAPVHLLCGSGPLSFNSETLTRTDIPGQRGAHSFPSKENAKYFATGDGITLVDAETVRTWMSYAGDALGLRDGYFDAVHHSRLSGPMVSGAFDFYNSVKWCAAPGGEWKQMAEPSAEKLFNKGFVFPNAPITGRFFTGNVKSVPPKQPRLEVVFLLDSEPFMEIKVPELNGLFNQYGENREQKHFVCIDLESRRLGMLLPAQKTWMIRELELNAALKPPILLNWPDTSVPRGSQFRFKPHLAGEGVWSAELVGAKEATPVAVDETGVSFRVASNELASLLLLKLTIKNARGTLHFPIPIHVQGLPSAFVWPDLNPGIPGHLFAAGFQSLALSKEKRTALTTDFYVSPDRIQEIFGPIDGTLALRTTAQRIEFLSIASKKIIGNIVTPPKAKYYPGGGALFEYDPESRALTRIDIADGKRGAGIVLPGNIALQGIACGAERDQPMSLFLERRENERSSQIGNLTITSWNANRNLYVVNSQTLQPGAWMQPQVWTSSPKNSESGAALNSFSFGRDYPTRTVGSRNGAILILQNHFAVITPRFSVVAPYPPEKGSEGFNIYRNEAAEGSITGILASNSEGETVRNGISEGAAERQITPCGRYAFVQAEPSRASEISYEVRTLEGNRPLFRINRIAVSRVDFGDSTPSGPHHIRLLQDNGPVVIQSSGGKVLQFINLDIPALASELLPENFHVISQPMPVLIDGGTYEYQIQTNNPSQVAGFQLRDKPSNATILPSGLLRFQSPQLAREPLRVPISIEITGKNGKSVLHEFSVIVLPRAVTTPPLPSKPAAPPPPSVPLSQPLL